jgi:hypothetical protein
MTETASRRNTAAATLVQTGIYCTVPGAEVLYVIRYTLYVIRYTLYVIRYTLYVNEFFKNREL